MSVIRLASVDVVYPGGTVALRDAGLDVSEGEFAVLVGSSGGGKTTLLRCLNGSVKPGRGSVAVDGTNVVETKGAGLRALRQRIAFIPQQFNLVKRSSVRANALAGRLGYTGLLPGLLGLFSAEDKKIVHANIDRLGLGDKALRRVDTLSGGEQQRVAICRALTQQPRIILADEPVSSLDHHLAVKIMKLLKSINQEDGITVVVALHDLRLAQSYADRIILLDRGSVKFSGSSAGMTFDDLKELMAGGVTA